MKLLRLLGSRFDRDDEKPGDTAPPGSSDGLRDPTLRVIRGSVAVDKTAAPDAFGVTDRGLVRPRNEDQFLIAELGRTLWIRGSSVGPAGERRPVTTCQARVYVVADGMGGHGGGDVASSVAMDSVADYVFEAMPWVVHLAPGGDAAQSEELRNALMVSQARVLAVAERKGLSHLKMGTTLTMAYVAWPTLYVLHAGDTRCYLVRGDQIRRMTTDHTLSHELESRDMVRPGAADERFGHILVNAVGAGSEELFGEIRRAELAPGDRLLLCSDGLTRHVSDDEIAAIVRSSRRAVNACRQLVALANERGGEDNVTALAVLH